MTNKELISFECERLENIRQNLIKMADNKELDSFDTCIRDLAEINFELMEKIEDNDTGTAGEKTFGGKKLKNHTKKELIEEFEAFISVK